MSQIAGPERLERKQEQAEADGEKWENMRPQKIWTPLEATGGDQATEVDIEVVDPPAMEKSDHTLLTSNFDNFLNLPDVPFNLFAMMLSITQLRGLTQVSSSWRKRITENLLENPARRNDLRARIQRALKNERYQYPSNEDISNAMWLSK